MLGVKLVRDRVGGRRCQIRADMLGTGGNVLEEGSLVGALQTQLGCT